MLTNFTATINNIADKLQQNLPITTKLIAGLFIIHIINIILRRSLLILGIRPRHISGLFGIVFAPLLHTDFEHLIFNSFPLFILMNLIIAETNFDQFVMITGMITVISGSLIWLFGRRAIHVGASAVILGYFGFLLASAYAKPSFMLVVIAFFCIYYFFGLILSLFPSDEKSSFEGHIFGLIAGIITSQIPL